MQSIKAIVAAVAISFAALCAATQPAHADGPTFYVAAPQANEWQTVNLQQAIVQKGGVAYLPLRATFQSLQQQVSVNPDGQANVIKIADQQSAHKLFISHQQGKSFMGISSNGPWYQVQNINGDIYIPMSFMQTLTNRQIAVSSNKQITLSDKAPTWVKDGNGYHNQNPFWAAGVQGYQNAAPAPTLSSAAAQPAVATKTASISADSVIASASAQMGVPYVYGGMSQAGFDCSGLTSFVFAQFGVQLPRTAEAQRAAATPVALNQLQPGDLVFWGQPAYHVGIYIGNGQYIHAPQPGQSVSIGSAQWFPYTSGGRF